VAKTFGKDIAYINSSLLSKDDNVVDDTLRNLLGKFFVVDEDNMIRYDEYYNPPIEFTSRVPMASAMQKPALQVQFTTEVENYEEEQKTLALATDTSGMFHDYYFKRSVPLNFSILERANKVGTARYIDVNPTYNYYVSSYEKLLKNNQTISENVLPSFYSIYSEGVYKQENVSKLNSLDGHFETELSNKFVAALGREKENLRDRYSQYFKQFSEVANNIIKKKIKTGNFSEDPRDGITILNDIATPYNSFMFTDAAIPLLTTEAVKAESFPMFNEIKFSTDKNTAFANIIKELKIGEEMMKETLTAQEGFQTLDFGSSAQEYIVSSLDNTPPEEVFTFINTQIRTWDIKEWITNKIFNNNINVGIRLGQRQTEATSANRGVQELFTKMLLAAKVNRLSNLRSRTLAQVMAGKSCYTEEVFYKITKYSSDNPNTPLATFFIPNSSELDVCRYIDTQIKYGKSYRYSITSYVLVMGSKYRYDTINKVSKTTMNFHSELMPSIKLMEIPFHYAEDLVILDNPPFAPDTSIVPFRNIENKILINFNGSTGDAVLQPIEITSRDKLNINSLKRSQRRGDDKLRYKSDDAPFAFEVYRSLDAPKGYRDFEGQKIAEVTTGNIATSGAFKDTIVVNTKYYYTFRSKDIHGNISNPTPVFLAEMRKDGGSPFLNVEVYDMGEHEENKNQKPSKKMRRYVQVLPTVSQGLLNVSDSKLLSVTTVKGVKNVVLGVADERLWGKKFRVRFTSKKTGRKIDLDMNFVVEHKLK